MKAIAHSFERKTPILHSCLFDKISFPNISTQRYDPQLYLANYSERIGIIVAFQLMLNGRTTLDKKEQAIFTLRSLLLTPGVVKAYNQNIKNSFIVENLENYFSDIIRERYEKQLADKILNLVYVNENGKFTLSAVQEAFCVLNLGYLHDIVEFSRPVLDDKKNYQLINSTNKNHDFTLKFTDSQLIVPKDHTAPEPTTPGEDISTNFSLFNNKTLHDYSNFTCNVPKRLDPQVLTNLQNKILESSPLAIKNHINQIRDECKHKNNFSTEEFKSIAITYNDMKQELDSYLHNVSNVREFNRAVLIFQGNMVKMVDSKLYKPSVPTITAAVNDLQSDNQSIAISLFDENQKMTELKDRSELSAKKIIDTTLQANVFKLDLQLNNSEHNYNDIDALWGVATNTSIENSPIRDYRNVLQLIDQFSDID